MSRLHWFDSCCSLKQVPYTIVGFVFAELVVCLVCLVYVESESIVDHIDSEGMKLNSLEY